MKAKIKLNKDFYLIFIFVVFCVILYIQYNFSKHNVIETFKNRKLAETFYIKNQFKTIFDNAELLFKSKLEENIHKINTFYLLYHNIKDLDPQKIVKILNKGEKEGHYEIFIIDRHYKIIKTSYKPDLGYNLGQFPVFKKILDKVFEGKEKIDISPIYIDPSSMNLKRYFLILSPDKKYLLQIAYVVDIYPELRKTYIKIENKYDDLKKLKLYYVSKYLIYPIHFSQRMLKKTPLNVLMKQTKKIFEKIVEVGGYKLNISHFSVNENTANKIFKIFQQKGVISKLDLKQHSYDLYTIINGFFKNFSNKLIIESVFSTKILEKDLKDLKNSYLLILLFVFFVGVFIRVITYYVSFRLNELVTHMKNNQKIDKSSSFIKEIDELISTYNWYRERLNEEIEKNKEILCQNKQFIVDTVHQIKTPLSIIRLNSDLIKRKLESSNDKEVKEFLDEIDAAISMLTASFEDLSYLSSEKLVEYKPSKTNISNILKERIEFFSTLAKAKNKKLISFIDENIIYEINKVEFERIVDNNISNAIEYSTGEEIIIELKKEKEIILKFISEGKKIKNPNLIFEKNYREHIHKRGLGVGLNIVKKICEKYGIEYKVFYKDGKNIFEYRFKI